MTTAPLDLVCLAPLRVEAIAVASGLRSASARVVRTGCGGACSARASRAIVADLAGARRPTGARRPPATVVTGVAGALSPGLAAGHLVVADSLIGVDDSLVGVDGSLIGVDGSLIGVDGAAVDIDPSTSTGLADALRAAGLTVRVAPIATSACVVRGAGPRRALAAATGALAVDLESQVLAAAAWPGPFAVVRAIVDRPEADLLSPATITGGIAALRSLRRAAPVIAAWAETLRPRRLSTAPGPR